jgi:hypothetical protein
VHGPKLERAVPLEVTWGELGAALSAWVRHAGPFVSNIISAALGYFTAVLLHRRDKVGLQKGAGRALLAEIFTNADRALSLSGTHQPEPFSDIVWSNEIAVISGLLRWKDLAEIVQTYDAGERLADDMRDPRFLDRLARDDPRAQGMCLDLADGFLAAIDILRAQQGLLNRAEFSHVDSRLTKLRDRATAARLAKK